MLSTRRLTEYPAHIRLFDARVEIVRSVTFAGHTGAAHATAGPLHPGAVWVVFANPA